MFALPPDLTPPSDDNVSGIACPSCHGCLNVRAEGTGHLHFTCRIGHSFSLQEVLTSLERAFEDAVWVAIRAAEEMQALLGDVVVYRRRVPNGGPEATYEARRHRTAEQSAMLRQFVERDEPITFTGPESEDNGGHTA